MSSSLPLRIAVDTMGGDLGPHLCVAASQKFKSLHPDVELVLLGNEKQLRTLIPESQSSNFDIIDCSEVVEMTDKASTALRHKRESSMWKSVELVKNGAVSACVSGGNTGALMAISRHVLGTVEGIERPAICKSMPTFGGRSYLLDLGANVDCSKEQLCEFALLGAALCQVSGQEKPKVALLNLGSESTKGPDNVRLASEIMEKESRYRFVGFIEGDDIYSGEVDVIVCDGFAGNIALKVSEGVVRYLSSSLGQWFTQTNWRKLLGTAVKSSLTRWWSQFDPDKFNGAMLLGLNGVVIKSHGSASETGFGAALEAAYIQIKEDQIGKIAQMFASQNSDLKAI